MKEMIEKMHPARRIAKAEEIADTVVWLSSEKASFIVGTILPIDGGITAGLMQSFNP
jgi:NAD(P)-dependent dehydrogenase (short-subunit alcohol dehydrogenase family)